MISQLYFTISPEYRNLDPVASIYTPCSNTRIVTPPQHCGRKYPRSPPRGKIRQIAHFWPQILYSVDESLQ